MNWVWPVIVEIAIVVLVPIAGYVGVMAYYIYKKQREHDRIIFGERSVEEWNGILGLTYSLQNRQERLTSNQEYMIKTLKEADMIEPHKIKKVEKPDSGTIPL